MIPPSYTIVPPPTNSFDPQLTRAINDFNHPSIVYCGAPEYSETMRGSSSDLLYDYVQREEQQKFDANLGERLKEEKKELTHERDQIQRKYPRDNRLINMNRRLKEIDKQLAGMR